MDYKVRVIMQGSTIEGDNTHYLYAEKVITLPFPPSKWLPLIVDARVLDDIGSVGYDGDAEEFWFTAKTTFDSLDFLFGEKDELRAAGWKTKTTISTASERSTAS